MTDNVTNELLLETLKTIQAKLSQHDHNFGLILNEIVAVKHHLAGLLQSDNRHLIDLASLSDRVDRIERRLDLTD